MEDEIIYELGIDFDSSFSFKDKDLKIIQYDNNLVQAITNRLKTNLNELELFYEEYGSIMLNFLGWKRNNETLNFIKSGLETVLKSEERIISWEYEVGYTENGAVRIDLVLYPNPNYSIATTLQINEDTIEVIE